jgi:hypothetical protein
MNEIQIIQAQLTTERAHFEEVANACAVALGAGIARTGAVAQAQAAGGKTAAADFEAACADYFAFALTRFEPQPAHTLAAQLAAGLSPEFLRAFTEVSRQYFESLDGMLTRNLPVTQWRTVSRIDADSIFAERARYSRVKATIPP